MNQNEIDSTLNMGIIFSIVWLAGVGSLIAIIAGKFGVESLLLTKSLPLSLSLTLSTLKICPRMLRTYKGICFLTCD